MPTINKGNRRKRVKEVTVNKKEIAKIYNSKNWKNLRNAYLLQHPLCERCLEKGITKAAEEIHHKTPIQTGKSELDKMALAYDPNNLMSLCKDCHHEIHKEMKKHY